MYSSTKHPCPDLPDVQADQAKKQFKVGHTMDVRHARQLDMDVNVSNSTGMLYTRHFTAGTEGGSIQSICFWPWTHSKAPQSDKSVSIF